MRSVRIQSIESEFEVPIICAEMSATVKIALAVMLLVRMGRASIIPRYQPTKPFFLEAEAGDDINAVAAGERWEEESLANFPAAGIEETNALLGRNVAGLTPPPPEERGDRHRQSISRALRPPLLKKLPLIFRPLLVSTALFDPPSVYLYLSLAVR